MISIWTLKICGKLICRPMNVSRVAFSARSEQKKRNVVPTHVKNDKCLENYCPVSLRPIYGKKPRIFNEMFHFFIQNVLISQNLSDFKPGDSFDNQILSVTCEIYKSLDDGFDVRSF